MAAAQEDLSERWQTLTCLEAVDMIGRHNRRKLHLLLQAVPYGVDMDTNFLDLVKHPALLLSMLIALRYRLVILVWTERGNIYKVVFDSTWSVPDAKNNQTRYWMFRKNGVLINQKPSYPIANKITTCPITVWEPKPLWKILNLPVAEPDPQTPLQTLHLLEKYNIVGYNFSFVVCEKPFYTECWIRPKTETDIAKVYVFYDNERRIGFFLADAQPRPTCEIVTGALLGKTNTTINNRQTSIFFRETGLNLALRLGLLTIEEFRELSLTCATFCGCLTLEYRNEKPYSVTYTDGFVSKETLVISSWNVVFEWLEHRGETFQEYKRECLQPLLNVLERYQTHPKKINTLFSKCLFQLNQFISKFKVFVFGSDDNILHELKTPMAVYFKKKFPKSKKSVYLKCSKGNDILALSYSKLMIVNLGNIAGVISNTTNDIQDLLKNVSESWSGCDSLDESGSNLFNLFQNMNRYLLHQFCLDISTLSFISMANLSNLIFWMTYLLVAQTWLIHPIEKTLASNRTKLRDFSKGGFSFSAKTKISIDDPIFENADERAKTILNLDIVSSYGYAASTMSVPGGFGATFENGVRLETSQRFKFFEFRAVFYRLYQLKIENRVILAAYHNYSPLGVFYIGKYPIDLVCIFDDGSLEIVQFDSAFCHGCNCSLLPNYADGKTREELAEKTKIRDQFTQSWIEKTNTNAVYKIITDCCTLGFQKKDLDKHFKSIAPLRYLVSGYSHIDGDISKPLSPDLTFLAIVNISCVCENVDIEKFGPIFTRSDNGVQTFNFEGEILLTSDYLEYLKNICTKVEIKNTMWAIFYKKDPVFPRVYKTLLKIKDSKHGNVKDFIKSVINLSCGYFGSNASKNVTKCIRITNSCPRKMNLEKYSVIPLDGNDENLFIIKTNKDKKKTNWESGTSFSLPIFCMITETAKMRLNQIFHFYHKYLRPNTFKILYAHIDSTIMVMSTDNLIDAAKSKNQFEQECKKIFSDNVPGHMKIVWKENQDWSFVTHNVASYALLSKNTNIAKMSSISNISPLTIFNSQRDILNKKSAKFSQNRRCNKLKDLETIVQEIIFGP